MYHNSTPPILDTDKLSYLLKPSPQWCAVNTINNSVSSRDEQKNFSSTEATFLLFLQRVKRITFQLAPVSGFHFAEQKAVYRHGGGRLKVSQEIQLVASHCPGLNLIRMLSSRVTAENCNKYFFKKRKLKKKKEKKDCLQRFPVIAENCLHVNLAS